MIYKNYVINILFGFFKQLDSMLPYGCSVKDHKDAKHVIGRWRHTRISLLCHVFVGTTFWRHLWSITGHTHGNNHFLKVTSFGHVVMCIPFTGWNITNWGMDRGGESHWFRMRVSGLVLSFKYGWLAQISILSFEPWHYLDSDLSRVINHVNTCKWRADIVYTH